MNGNNYGNCYQSYDPNDMTMYQRLAEVSSQHYGYRQPISENYQIHNSYYQQEDWKNSGSAYLICSICENSVRNSHVKKCKFKGINDGVSKECSCNIRNKSFDNLPICSTCYSINLDVAKALYGNEIFSGHLYKLNSNRDYSGILYSEITTQPKSEVISDNMSRSTSMSSLSTAFTDNESESTMDSETEDIDDNYITSLIRGLNVKKVEYMKCFSCGHTNKILCIQNKNGVISGNLHGICHEETPAVSCPCCHMVTFNKMKYWELLYDIDYDNNSLYLNSTITDTKDLTFGSNSQQRQLLDYSIKGKDKNDNILDKNHLLTCFNKNSILYSCIEITQNMIFKNMKVYINQTQNTSNIHKHLFDYDYLTINNYKLIKNKDSRKCSRENYIERNTVSPVYNDKKRKIFFHSPITTPDKKELEKIDEEISPYQEMDI